MLKTHYFYVQLHKSLERKPNIAPTGVEMWLFMVPSLTSAIWERDGQSLQVGVSIHYYVERMPLKFNVRIPVTSMCLGAGQVR